MAEPKKQIIQRIRACFRSENDFERYKPQIVDKIKKGDEYYFLFNETIIILNTPV